jgi:hypothetical protein
MKTSDIARLDPERPRRAAARASRGGVSVRTLFRVPPAAIAALVGMVGAPVASAQAPEVVHPRKAVYAASEAWPAVAPGQFPLKNFQPFRAVYARRYQGGNGQPREDRVIVAAERIAWGPTSAILVTLIDTGSLDYDDTTPRVHTRMFAEDDQRLLFQISPVPGTPRDYLLVNTDGTTTRATRVDNATGEAMVQDLPFPTPQLGVPALWVVGSMALAQGQTIRFAPADAPAASNILGARPFQISGRQAITAGPAGRHDAWIASYPLGMANGRVMQNFVIDRPPYILGKQPKDLDLSENTEQWTLRLIEFATFGAPARD